MVEVATCNLSGDRFYRRQYRHLLSFQENWISANTVVELLEAEQEKFILGVTTAYRCYDLADDTQRQQMAKMAIENFINQVNNIHLKQVQRGSDTQVKEEKTEQAQPTESK